MTTQAGTCYFYRCLVSQDSFAERVLHVKQKKQQEKKKKGMPQALATQQG